MLQRAELFSNTRVEMGTPYILPLAGAPPSSDQQQQRRASSFGSQQEVRNGLWKSNLPVLLVTVLIIGAVGFGATSVLTKEPSETQEYNSYMATLFEDMQAENSHLKSEMRTLKQTIDQLQQEKNKSPPKDPMAELQLKLEYAQLKQDYARCDEARLNQSMVEML